MSEVLTELYALLESLRQANAQLMETNAKLQEQVERIALIRGPCDECPRAGVPVRSAEERFGSSP